MKRRRNTRIIGLVAAVITFTALSVFAKPLYKQNGYKNHCWHNKHNENNKQDSTTNY